MAYWDGEKCVLGDLIPVAHYICQLPETEEDAGSGGLTAQRAGPLRLGTQPQLPAPACPGSVARKATTTQLHSGFGPTTPCLAFLTS